MGDSGAALFDVLTQLDDKSGELAEVRKAEIDARHDGFHGANVTEARENAAHAAKEYTKEAIDLQADIDSLLRWKDYWTLMITRGE